MTEESQHGTADSLGWEQVSGIRIEVKYMCVCVWGGREGREGGKERSEGVVCFCTLCSNIKGQKSGICCE